MSMNEDLDLFDPFRYFIPHLKSIINPKEEAPMLRTYNYLYNNEAQEYRVIFRDEDDRPGIWYVWIDFPPFGENHEDTIALFIKSLNAAEAEKQ